MDNLLAGVGEYLNERGYYVLFFLQDPVPHIKVKRRSKKGLVECQMVDGKLRLKYQNGDYNYRKNWDAMGKPAGISPNRPILPASCRSFNLSEPNSLGLILNQVKKHLDPPVLDLKGGIG
jgi:hypothetical protein